MRRRAEPRQAGVEGYLLGKLLSTERPRLAVPDDPLAAVAIFSDEASILNAFTFYCKIAQFKVRGVEPELSERCQTPELNVTPAAASPVTPLDPSN